MDVVACMGLGASPTGEPEYNVVEQHYTGVYNPLNSLKILLPSTKRSCSSTRLHCILHAKAGMVAVRRDLGWISPLVQRGWRSACWGDL